MKPHTPQKFFRGHRVFVEQAQPHFDQKYEAIVVGSYSDMFQSSSEHSHHSYQLFIMKGSPSHWHDVAWYEEDGLRLVSKDRDEGERILQENKAKVTR